MKLKKSLSFVGMKLVLVILKVKYIIMTSHIQYKIQYKYNFGTNLDLTITYVYYVVREKKLLE